MTMASAPINNPGIGDPAKRGIRFLLLWFVSFAHLDNLRGRLVCFCDSTTLKIVSPNNFSQGSRCSLGRPGWRRQQSLPPTTGVIQEIPRDVLDRLGEIASAVCFETKRTREQYKDADTLELVETRDGKGRDRKSRSMEHDIRQRLDAKQYREAFELLMDRFQNKVFRLAFSMVRNETMAEDLTQDVLMKIWKALPGYQGDASLSTWIYTISRNTCLTEIKRRTTRPTTSLDEPEFEDALQKLPACQTSDREAGAELDIQVMLARLPEKYRRVITLFYLEQKSYEEVSAMLGIPMGTVKTFLFRAKKELLKFNRRNENVYA